MSAEWEIRAVGGWGLWRDGVRIIDTDGTPILYDTQAEAQHVADHWERYRAPTVAELRGMSDDQLRERAGL